MVDTTFVSSKTSQQPLSFVKALASSNVISSASPLTLPTIRWDVLCIKIRHVDYVKGIEACKCNLYSKLVLNKGDKPYTTRDIMGKLTKQWESVGK